MHPKKTELVLAMQGRERLAYFVRKAAGSQDVWSLHDPRMGHGRRRRRQQGSTILARARFEMCAAGQWHSHQPRMIELSNFLEKWLPGMNTDGIRAAVFPTPSAKGVVVDLDQLSSEVEAELKQYV